MGSSSLEIQKGLTESLTGRFQLTRAYHWNYQESREGYGLNFDEYLKFGGYPGSYIFKDPKEWADYVISYTKLLGQIQEKGNVELIKNYIRLFEGAFLIRALEKYHGKQLKTKSSSPKILPLAPCFYQLELLSDYDAKEKGRVFELIVGAQLVRTGENIFYWREGKDEVDYILKSGKNLWAIEVSTSSGHSSSGLQAFKKKFPKARLVTINLENYDKFESDPIKFLNRAVTTYKESTQSI